MKRFNLSTQVEIAISVALCVALSYWKIFTMPQGGSVSLQMVPLVLLTIRQGTSAGLLGGALFGFIDLMLGGYVIHPIQGLLDYPVAFSVIGLAGLWMKYAQSYTGHIRNAFAMAFAFSLRYLAHVLTGVFFFSEFAGDQNVWFYSITYNATYLFPELLVTLAVALLLLTRRDLVETKQRSNPVA